MADTGVSYERREDWGEAPDVQLGFVGRNEELVTLRDWVLRQRCRLVALRGVGGIGKTALAARLAQDVAPAFHRVFWRSLRDAPPIRDWLAGVVGFLSDQRAVPPPDEAALLPELLQLLRDGRCLLVLDNFETLLEAGQPEGRYRDGYAGYGRLLRVLGEASHQSCLVVTSREAPPELALLGAGAVHALELDGLAVTEGQALLADKRLAGTNEDWTALITRFGGNGLALKIVGESIREVFAGDIAASLEGASSITVFSGIRRLLAEQIERSSPLERTMLGVLAVEREPVSLSEFMVELGPGIGRAAVVEAVEALRRRSLVERTEADNAAGFTLQSVVLEYVTDRLAEDVSEEILCGRAVRLVNQPLVKAQAKDYVRQAQERLLGAPILARLNAREASPGSGHEGGTQSRLLALLEAWRGRPVVKQGYGPGNVVNLLRLLRGGSDMSGLDLSHLAIRQAYLADVDARDSSLAYSHVAQTAFADAFDSPGSVALSGDGALLAAGTATGQVWLWRVADRTPVWTTQGDAGAAWGIALSADGHLLASAGGNGMLRVWETSGGRPVATLQGHTGAAYAVALSADGGLLASGGADGTVRLWETSSARQLALRLGHTGGVYSVAIARDGHIVASGSADGTIRLWRLSAEHTVATIHGHSSAVWRVALSASGRLLASAGDDRTVRLWEAKTGRPLATLQGHTAAVWGLAVSADGHLLASGGEDGTVRLWDSTGRPLAILQGHTSVVRGVALSADGETVASGGFEGTIRLWEARPARPVATLQGHAGESWSVAVSADGQVVASGGGDGAVRLWKTSTGQLRETLRDRTGAVWGVALDARGHVVACGAGDGTVRLWETSTGRLAAVFRGHAGVVRGVALSADGELVATGGADASVRLWDSRTSQLRATLIGHVGAVWGVALSADGEWLASSGQDGAVRLWETRTGRLMETLQGHSSAVWAVALSANGHLVASGGIDGMVRVWEARTGRSVATLQGHAGAVWGVALSADGDVLASGGEDGRARLWDLSTGRARATPQGHTGALHGVALSADGQLLVSGGFDGLVKLWQARTGSCLHTLRSERRYERLDIAGLTGITHAQRQAMLALGATHSR
jgi:WD40 repeat protein